MGEAICTGLTGEHTGEGVGGGGQGFYRGENLTSRVKLTFILVQFNSCRRQIAPDGITVRPDEVQSRCSRGDGLGALRAQSESEEEAGVCARALPVLAVGLMERLSRS